MNRARIGASLFALFVVALGYGVLVPLAPDLAAGSAGGRSVSFHTGAMSFVYLASFAALAPVWGRFADRGPIRAIGAGGLSAFAAAFMALGRVEGLASIYATLALAGIAASAVVPTLQVQVRAVADEAARTRFLVLFAAASFAGWFVGPALATWARGAFGPAVLGRSFGLVATLGLAAAAFASIALRSAVGPRDDAAVAEAAAATPPAGERVAAFAAMAVTFGIGAFEVSIVLWAVQVLRLEPAELARMLLECTVIMMGVQATILLVPRALPKWAPASAGGGFAAMAAALAIVPVHPAPWLAFAAVALLAISATLLQAMLTVHAVARKGGRPGEALGLQLGFANGGQALGSLAAGGLFSALGTSFFAAAAILAAAAIWVPRRLAAIAMSQR